MFTLDAVLKRLPLLLVALMGTGLAFGQMGPGGAHNSTQNRYWFDANDLTGTLNDGDRVATWVNKGGNTDNATQSNNGRRPQFRSAVGKLMNGHPVIEFDGANDYLGLPDDNDLNSGPSQAERSFFTVIRTSGDISSRQVIYEEGGTIRGLNIYIFNNQLWIAGWNQNNDGAGAPWNFQFINTAISTNTEYYISFIKDGNSTTTGTITGYLNGVQFGTINNVGLLYAHGANIGLGAKNGDTHYETGTSGGTGQYFDGDMAEFIHYKFALNNAQRIVVENYLSAKYAITPGANDNYTMDNVGNGNYDHEVAGIGQDASGNSNDSAQGPSIFKFYNASGLGNNEYFIWGHNNNNLVETQNLTPATVDKRLVRSWRVSEMGEVGTVSIDVDISGLSLSGATASDFFLLVDATDTNFTNATIINAASKAGNLITFNGVNINTANHFTLGINEAPLGTYNTGPGGVGDNTQYRFWYDANDLSSSLDDGDAVQFWINKGGSGVNAGQGSATARPLYRSVTSAVMNDYPLLQFDGSNDRLVIADNADMNIGGPWSNRTYYVAFETGSNVTTRKVIFEEGGQTRGMNIYIFNGRVYIGGWNQNNDGSGAPWNFVQINAPIATNTGYVLSYVYSGNGTTTGTITGFLNGQQFGTINNVGILYAHSANNGIGSKEGDTRYETGGSGGSGQHWLGNIAEYALYNLSSTEAERIIIENYLTAKYGLAMSANDHYTMDDNSNGDYDHQVAGIGRESDGAHDDGKGEGALRVSSPAGLGNGEYLIWGHNGERYCNSDDVPGSLTYRLERVWRISEVGEVGNCRITFDLSGFTHGAESNIRLLVDNDGVFGNATLISPTSTGTNLVVFDGVNLNNAEYLTLGSTDPFGDPTTPISTTWLGASTAWNSDANWTNGVPQKDMDAIIAAAPNAPLISGFNGYCANITIQAGAGLVIAGTDSLFVSGNWSNSGIFTPNNSVVVFDGSCAASTIFANGFQDFHGLIIENPFGCTITGGTINLRGIMRLREGNLATGNALNLISDAVGTASISEITGGSISGNITMQRYINAGQTNWRFFSSAVSGVTLAGWDDNFITSGIVGSDFPNWPSASNKWPSLYYYDETQPGDRNTGFTPPASMSRVIGIGEGYWVWCGDTITGTLPFLVDQTGPTITGTHSLPVSFTSTPHADDGWSMVGNPYPSTIDWDDADWTKVNMDNAIYIWDPDNQVFASYVSGIGTNGGSRYIPSSQAFWVKANNSGPSLTIREGVKADVDQSYFKTGTPTNAIRIAVKDSLNPSRRDEMVLRIAQGATMTFEGNVDAYKFKSSNVNVPMISTRDDQGDLLSINTFWVDSTMMIPVDVQVNKSGPFTLEFNGQTCIQNMGCVVLWDTYTSQYHDLKSISSLDVTLYDSASTTRFYIILGSPATVTVTDASCDSIADGTIAYAPGHTSGTYNFTWTNALGDTLRQSFGQNSDVLSGLIPGDYFVNVSGVGICGASTARLTVEDKSGLEASFMLTKTNFVTGENVSPLNLSSNATLTTWDFGDGSGIITQTNPTHSYSTPGTYVLKLRVSNGNCIDEYSTSIQVGVTGVEEAKLSEDKLYPNPNNGNFIIDHKGTESANVRVFNSALMLVMEGTVKPGVNEFRQNLAAGTYIVQIYGRVGGRHFKMVVQR